MPAGTRHDLSGLYSHTSGAIDNQHSKVPEKYPIISDLIRNAGYEVAFIGKSHVEGSLMDRYWDYYFGFRGQADYQNPVIVEGRNGKFGEPQKYNEYVDDLLTKKAVAWLSARIRVLSACSCGSMRRTRRSTAARSW